jgi:hypothetical protein
MQPYGCGPVRSKEEILRGVEALEQRPPTVADNFKYGCLIGKLLALEWVLGETPGSDLSIQYDFEDWRREQKAGGRRPEEAA